MRLYLKFYFALFYIFIFIYIILTAIFFYKIIFESNHIGINPIKFIYIYIYIHRYFLLCKFIHSKHSQKFYIYVVNMCHIDLCNSLYE